MNHKFNSAKCRWVVTSLTFFTIFSLLQLLAWAPVKFLRMGFGGGFIDTQSVLYSAKCYQSIGDAVFSRSGECSGYLYGSTLLRILSFLNLEPKATQVVGYILMMILALSISYKIDAYKSFRENRNLIAVVLSPPIFLLAERANFDILILVLVIFASVLFSAVHEFWALLPLTLASLCKFYTLPLFLVFLLLNKGIKKKSLTFAVGALVTLRLFFDLKLIQNSFPSQALWEFGMSVWTRYLYSNKIGLANPGELINNISGFLILCLILMFITIFLKKSKISIQSTSIGSTRERFLFYSLFGSHASCYILGMSYDYRLVFLAIATIIYLKCLSTKGSHISNLVLVLLLLSMWLTYPTSFLQPFGDFATEVITIILSIRFIQLLHQDLQSNHGR